MAKIADLEERLQQEQERLETRGAEITALEVRRRPKQSLVASGPFVV